MSIKTKQQVAYIALLILVIILSSGAYHLFKDEWVSFRKGEKLLRAGEAALALPLFQQAIAAGLQTPDVFLQLAETLSGQKSYDEAITLYRAILAAHPHHRLARILLARVLTWDGRFEEAILEYRKILEEST